MGIPNAPARRCCRTHPLGGPPWGGYGCSEGSRKRLVGKPGSASEQVNGSQQVLGLLVVHRTRGADLRECGVCRELAGVGPCMVRNLDGVSLPACSGRSGLGASAPIGRGHPCEQLRGCPRQAGRVAKLAKCWGSRIWTRSLTRSRGPPPETAPSAIRGGQDRAATSAWAARSETLSILPTGFFGMASTTKNAVGRLKPVRLRAQRDCSADGSTAEPGRGWT